MSIKQVHIDSELMEGVWLELNGTENFIVPGGNFAVFSKDVELMGSAETLHDAMRIAYAKDTSVWVELFNAQCEFERNPSRAAFIWANTHGKLAYGESAWTWTKRNWLALLAKRHFDQVICEA